MLEKTNKSPPVRIGIAKAEREKKFKNESDEKVNKVASNSFKKFCSKIGFGFASFFKGIGRCFTWLFKKKEDDTDLDTSSSKSSSKGSSDPKDNTTSIYDKRAVAQAVEDLRRFREQPLPPFAKPPVAKEPPKRVDPLVLARNDACKRLNELVEKLNFENVNEMKNQGLPNITHANCYMNSALQNLEAFSRVYPAFNLLITQPLKNKSYDSLPQLENKILNIWAPIDEKEENFQDRLLFKWSFLVLMQAKNYGTPEQIGEALDIHHSVCFNVLKEAEFRNGPGDQKDSSSYFELWLNNLKLTPLVFLEDGLFYSNIVNIPIKKPEITDEALQEIDREVQEFRENKEKQIKDFEDRLAKLRAKEEGKSLERQIEDAKGILDKDCAKHRLDLEYGVIAKKVINARDLIESRFGGDIKMLPPPGNTLVFQFQRFTNELLEDGEGVQKKIKSKINFDDLPVLDLGPYINPPGGNYKYELTAFNVHIGEFGGGHYIAYVKKEDGWYECNDRVVTKVEGELPIHNAYMCTYVKLK